MKVGIIRCMQTEDYCPGTADFMALRNKQGSFADLDGELELVGFLGIGNNPMVGATVAIAVAIDLALNK